MGGGAAWFIVQQHGFGPLALDRIDAQTGSISTIRGIGEPQDVAADGGSVWASSCVEKSGDQCFRSTVFELDPSTGKPLRSVALAAEPIHLAAGEDGVWVLTAQYPNPVLVRIDPHTARVVARISIPRCFCGDLAVGAGAVWISTDRGVTRVAPATNRVVHTIRIRDADLIGAGAGALWVNTARFGEPASVAEVDASTGRVIRTVEGPGFGFPVVAGGRVWIAVVQGPIVIESLSYGGTNFELFPVAPTPGPPRYFVTGIGGPVAALGIGEGAIWTGTDESGQVIRIQLGPNDLEGN